MANWYKFTAYNAPTFYGYSDTHDRAAIAAAYLERLNRSREINVYAMEVLSGDADQWDENIARAMRNDDIAFGSDTTLHDVQA